MTMGSTGFRSVVAPKGASSPIGSLARRRPLLHLKAKRLEDGGEVGDIGEKDVGVASVDTLGHGAISNEGGFLGSPEMGGHRGDADNPNVSSGLNAAADSLGGERSFGGRLADFAFGERELAFDPVTGKFDASRDWAATAARGAVPMMFGPLGPLVSLGMRMGRDGEPLGDERSGLEARGAGMADGGTPPPAVQALIQQAMSQGKPPQAAQGAPAAPQAPPGPFRFIPDPEELRRRYASREEPARLDGGALQYGGSRSGLIQGSGDGRSDDVDSLLDEDGYVIPASEVSAAGNGSTEAGAARIAQDVLGRPEAAQPLDRVDGGTVPAKTSRGEMYVAPEDVDNAGGPGALEQFVKQTRSRHIRDLKKRPGPRR